MKRFTLFLALYCMVMTGNVMAQESLKKVLIYTRNGEGYVHDNINKSVVALEKICDDLSISYVVSDDPSIFTTDFNMEFDAVIFSNTNNEAFDTDEQRDIFQKFIRNGGGFVGIHSACGSERDWSWFSAMVGAKFVRHPAFQPFDIKVLYKKHPATSFLPDTWSWEDECYFMNRINPDINVLLAADLTTIEDAEIETYPGDTFGDLFPLAWYHEYDGGREFFTALGHDKKHYKDKNFIQHLRGGIVWVLELKEDRNL
jgi:type 1 glutamine amidotransferase